ncbi:MAG: HAMP domain-containing sensor histidine kinase [Actinobacteria bacterium]|nr:HAMP domain-containing sensor histidine kinase [Actinomycetota bacterium]
MTELLSEAPSASRVQRLVASLSAARPARLGLRTRVLLMFSLGSLLLAVFLAAAAYSFTRSSLLTQRDRTAVAEVGKHADFAATELANDSAVAAIAALGAQDVSQIVIYQGDDPEPSGTFDPAEIPQALLTRVRNDQVAARMVGVVDDAPAIIVGIPLDDVADDAAYFEAVDISEIEETLNSVGLSLFFGALITSMFGVVLGWFAANRAVRPLADAAQAAQLIAGGRLDTRLEPSDDPDLRTLAQSFNDMASALQSRVERDARFASDVSHELRSPLMTLAASVEVMQARRGDLPERAQTALDLLASDVVRFQGLVEDLLEISRFDAGAIRLHREDLLVAEFVRAAVAVSSVPSTPVTVSERGECMVMQGDRRRLARVVANLIDNARLHGGGEAAIYVSEAENEGEPIGHVWIAVEDSGPGVPPEERDLVFERFARGAVAGRRSSSDGAGLGLALVDEHIRMHGGRVWVEDRRDGEPGARFVLELPAEEVGI